MIFSPEYTLYAKTLIGIIAIVNPLGAIPVFLSLCGDRTHTERRQIARVSAFAVASILILAIWSGDALLGFFGIGIPAFRTGGGLLLLLIAINMMHAKQSHAKHSPQEAEEADNMENIAVVPLAIPMMSGPGAISLVIVDAHQAIGWGDRLILSADIIVVAIAVWGA